MTLLPDPDLTPVYSLSDPCPLPVRPLARESTAALLHHDRLHRHLAVLTALLLSPAHRAAPAAPAAPAPAAPHPLPGAGLIQPPMVPNPDPDVTNPFALPADTASTTATAMTTGRGGSEGGGESPNYGKGGRRGLLGRMKAVVASVAAFGSGSGSSGSGGSRRAAVDDAYVTPSPPGRSLPLAASSPPLIVIVVIVFCRAGRAAAALLPHHASAIRAALSPPTTQAAPSLPRLCALVNVVPVALALAGNLEALGVHRLPPAVGACLFVCLYP